MTFQDLALDMDRWVDQFADELKGLSRLPRPAHVPEDLETLRRLQIAHGQITTRHPKKESEALLCDELAIRLNGREKSRRATVHVVAAGFRVQALITRSGLRRLQNSFGA